MIVKEEKIKPLLRWAGGKLWMIDRIRDFIPTNIRKYHEPFIGGASVFLNLQTNAQCHISDTNAELICFYDQVKTNMKSLITEVKKFKNSEKEYYNIRSSKPITNLGKAARFYFLNRTCFNGLYRVNQAGFYNVPYGYRDISLIDVDGFSLLHEKLQNTSISCCDFETAFEKIENGDFAFLDPPYTVAHNKNGFIEYNQKIFSWEDQERLAGRIKLIMKKNAKFIMTNAYHDSIRKLYKGIGKQFEIERYSTISGVMNSRFKISELIITNCT